MSSRLRRGRGARHAKPSIVVTGRPLMFQAWAQRSLRGKSRDWLDGARMRISPYPERAQVPPLLWKEAWDMGSLPPAITISL